MAPGPSLTGVRLILPDHVMGFPVLRALPLCACHRHYPGAATGCFVCSLPQPWQPSPEWQPGRPAHRPFRGLFSVHSRYSLHTRAATVNFVARFAEGFNRFVTSAVAPVASGWSICRAGLAPAGKRHLFTAHTHAGHSPDFVPSDCFRMPGRLSRDLLSRRVAVNSGTLWHTK